MIYVQVHWKKKENYCLKQIGNVVWTFRWFFFFPFQVYRVTVVDSAHHLLDQVFKNAYTVHKMKFRYVIVWNSIKFVSKKKRLLYYSISKHILRAFELPSISCHRYYDKLANKKQNKKPYHQKVTENYPPYSLHCSVMTYDRIPLHLGPSIFPPFFVIASESFAVLQLTCLCVYHFYCSFPPTNHPNNCLQQNTTDNILRYIHRMICTMLFFSVLKSKW